MFNEIREKLKGNIVKEYIFNKIDKYDKIIFVVRVDLIGDYIASKDFLRLLRNSNKFKDYKIVLCVNKIVRDFILDFDKKYIDAYIEIDTRKFRNFFYKTFLFKVINKYKYDYAINYMSIRNKDSETIIKGVKTGIKCGIVGRDLNLRAECKQIYDKNYNKLFDTTYSYDKCGLELINKLTGESNGSYVHGFELDLKFLKRFQKKYSKPYAVIFPSASQKRKIMPFAKFLELSQFLYDKYGLISYIAGSKDDEKLFKDYDIDKILHIENLCGKFKLSELPYLFKNSKIVLTNDTCAMHIARCTNTDTVVFSNVALPSRISDLNIVKNENQNIYSFNAYGCYIINPQDFYHDLINNKPIKSEYLIENIDLDNAHSVIEILMTKY